MPDLVGPCNLAVVGSLGPGACLTEQTAPDIYRLGIKRVRSRVREYVKVFPLPPSLDDC